MLSTDSWLLADAPVTPTHRPIGSEGFCKEVDMIEAQHKKLILAIDGSPHSNAAIELVAIDALRRRRDEIRCG